MAATFTELADYVAGLAAEIERFAPVLARCLEAVESVAASSEDAAELVAWAFLDSLSPDDRRRLAGWLGPRTRALLDESIPIPRRDVIALRRGARSGSRRQPAGPRAREEGGGKLALS